MSFGSGIPGVGVAPFGTFAFAGAGIPGVAFAVGVIGLAESPGGRLLASTFCNPFPLVLLFEFATFELVPPAPPQPLRNNVENAAAVIIDLLINKYLVI